MLNVFYWYAIMWGAVGILYGLGWSDYCKELDDSLKLFLIISVIVSLCLGYIYRNRFVYKSENTNFDIKTKFTGTIAIYIMAVIEFVYQKGVPLYSVIVGETVYGEMKGVPIMHTILINAILFYSPYLFYRFLESNNRAYLAQSLSVMFISLLMFSKGILAFNAFIIINLAVAKTNKKYHFVTRKNVTIAIIVVLILLYLNGGLTNLRSGMQWGDVLLVKGVCHINDKWPSWIPFHYGWAYTYIVSPLANLSLNLSKYKASTDLGELIISVLPQLLVKRVFDLGDFTEGILLYTPILNACTGFIESVIAYGYIGLWFYYIYFFGIVLIIMRISEKSNKSLPTLNYSIVSMMVVVLFFYNTLKTSATALLPFVILLYPKISRIKIVYNRH